MKPRLLFISSRPLYPMVYGGLIRTVQQLEFLKKTFVVDVLYISPDNDDLPYIKNYVGVEKIYRFKIGRFRSFLQTLRFIFNDLPLQVNYYYNKKVAKKIKSVISQYEYVFCNNIRTAEYVRRLRKREIIKYLDFVDAISMNYDKARNEAKGIKRLIYGIDYYRCKRYEQKCLKDFDSCAVISDVDKEYILSCQG